MRALAAVLVLTILAVAPTAAQPDHEIVFWQSIVTSTNPADFEAYLGEFPDGVFRRLAQNRIATLAAPVSGRDARERALATFSGTARSARRWWFCRAASWRWAATR